MQMWKLGTCIFSITKDEGREGAGSKERRSVVTGKSCDKKADAGAEAREEQNQSQIHFVAVLAEPRGITAAIGAAVYEEICARP